MKTSFYYIERGGKKVYAFSGGGLSFESKEKLLKKLKTLFTKEEAEILANKDFAFLKKQPNDVFSMFEQYFGVDLYNINESDCFKNPKLYIKLFTPNEIKKIKKSGRELKSFWHFMCGHLHLCPKIATINFKKIKEELILEKENYGLYDSFTIADKIWLLKITDVLHKTFGDKQTFYFSKWNYVANPKISSVNIRF